MKTKTLGFGFDPERTTHYFSLHLAKGEGLVRVAERFEWHGELPAEVDLPDESEDLKVIVELRRFKDVADEVKAEFNRRLVAHAYASGRWPAKGAVALDRSFGKEIVLLLWAIEACDENEIPTALRNWMGLSPEERWWLFTMANAATGQAIKGRNRGWRKAVRFALCENPVTEGIIRKRPAQLAPSLFEEME